jgi:DNA-binding transcriptional regulator YdaS (Cro superfamily)
MLSITAMRNEQQSAVKRLKDFGGRRLAARLRELDPDNPLTSQAISQWTRVPAERVLPVEAATGIPRHELRPDLYPVQERAT